jgi:hypothetical protein
MTPEGNACTCTGHGMLEQLPDTLHRRPAPRSTILHFVVGTGCREETHRIQQASCCTASRGHVERLQSHRPNCCALFVKTPNFTLTPDFTPTFASDPCSDVVPLILLRANTGIVAQCPTLVQPVHYDCCASRSIHHLIFHSPIS